MEKKATKPKKKATKPVVRKTETAIVIKEVSLTERQIGILTAPTPQEFVKSKPGRGGKAVKYVETGYVITVLNRTFGPLNWEFEVLAEGETQRQNEKNTEGEVWVRGKLTIIDHKNGYRVSKTQYGQHPIHKNVPIGDAKKAAESDSLKKCASLFGVAMDVYWKQLDGEEKKPDNKGEKGEMSKEEMFRRAKQMIDECDDTTTLAEWWKRIEESKHYSKEQKAELIAQINAKIDQKQK